MGQQCEVRGFYDNFQPITNVPFATVATSWCDGVGGDTYILIFHEVLYFGDTMGHSLINPNQLRHHGIQVHDNPFETDPDRKIGVELSDDVKLPFLTEGSTIYFESTYETNKDLQDHQHIVLTCDSEWRLHNVILFPTIQ